MDEDTSKSTVDDAELDQMIASIKGQPSAPPTIVGNGAPISSSDGSTLSNGQVTPTDPTTSPAPTTPPINSSMIPNSDDAPLPDATSALAAPPSIPEPTTPPPLTPTNIPPELSGIKQGALAELRPLVDRLTLPPEEKFNTTLLIIRSTDDASLLPAAYEAARAIPDDNRRAAALLDVIKEVDFFAQQVK